MPTQSQSPICWGKSPETYSRLARLFQALSLQPRDPHATPSMRRSRRGYCFPILGLPSAANTPVRAAFASAQPVIVDIPNTPTIATTSILPSPWWRHHSKSLIDSSTENLQKTASRAPENTPATLFIGVRTPPPSKKFEKTRFFCSFLFTTASEFRMIEVTEELKTFPQGPVLLAAETSSLNSNFTNYGGSIG